MAVLPPWTHLLSPHYDEVIYLLQLAKDLEIKSANVLVTTNNLSRLSDAHQSQY